MKENPSLKPELPEAINDAHQDAVLDLIKVTPFEEDELPSTCPYTVEQLFDDDFLPEDPPGSFASN